jgi:hypothetical protein
MRISAWEREREVLRTLVQKNLFPTIVKGLLRVLILFALEDGSKRGDVLYTSPNPVRDKILPKPKKIGATPTSASRKRISDLRLPFLIEPGRELSIDPRWWIISLTVRGIRPAVELRHRQKHPVASMDAP